MVQRTVVLDVKSYLVLTHKKMKLCGDKNRRDVKGLE